MPTISYHQHSQLAKITHILEQLKKGKNLALVSEAGTPGISDPGAKLISYLIEQMPDLKIIPIPGPSALTTALSISGFSADKFLFLGFPPVKKKRKKFFEEVVNSKYTVVFYESPHRIIRTLEELNVILNPPEADEESRRKRVVLCRELTKKFEIIYRGQIKKIIQQLNPLAGGKIKGEFVVVVSNK